MTTPRPYPLRDDWFVIDDDEAQAIGLSPGVQWDEKNGVWICHRNQIPLLGTPGMECLERLAPPNVEISFADDTQLRPWQRAGVDFLSSRRGTLLADAPRVGKTGQIVATHDPATGPLIVVAPLATRHVWLSWFRRRWPDEPAAVLTGRNYDRDRVRDAKLVFCHYDVIVDWASVGLRKIGTLAFDEAHKLSKRKSRRTQGATIMAPQAERIVCATGTPLWNKPEGLWALLNICNPSGWGTYHKFTERFCNGKPGAHGWTTGDAQNVVEFKQRIAEVMIRRVWCELVDDLIPTERDVITASISASDERELAIIAAILADESQSPRTLVGEMARYRRLVGRLKAPMAVAKAHEIGDSGRPVVVWVWHKDVATRIEKDIPLSLPCWSVTGRVPERKRESILDQWRACPNGVLIMSLGVGETGIDLSHASDCVFAELDWTPAVIGQAEMRTFSPMRGDRVTYIVADHEVDEKLARVLAAKCEQAMLLGTPAADTAVDVIGQVMRGEVSLETNLSDLTARVRQRVQKEGTTYGV